MQGTAGPGAAAPPLLPLLCACVCPCPHAPPLVGSWQGPTALDATPPLLCRWEPGRLTGVNDTQIAIEYNDLLDRLQEAGVIVVTGAGPGLDIYGGRLLGRCALPAGACALFYGNCLQYRLRPTLDRPHLSQNSASL